VVVEAVVQVGQVVELVVIENHQGLLLVVTQDHL
jgi:hypothetical protein